MKKVTLTWETSFNTDEEVQQFIKRIAQIHEERYATKVVENDLLSGGSYKGSINNITVKVKETK